MPNALIDRLRARGFVPPDYEGGGLVNLAATVLDVLGVRDDTDPPPLRALEPSLREGVRQVVVVLADGLGLAQLRALRETGDIPFIASILERAERHDGAQLIEATTIFPSTTAAAITTLNTARTPQEHGNLAYFVWLDEFAQVTQMLRWGPGVNRRGSYFDDQRIDPREYVKVPSVHARLRQRGGQSWVIEPEMFRAEAMTRMHAAEAGYAGYYLPSSMSVRLRDLLAQRPWGDAPAYVYAYWAGIDSVAHVSGPQSADHATEAALFDKALERAIASRPPGDTLIRLPPITVMPLPIRTSSSISSGTSSSGRSFETRSPESRVSRSFTRTRPIASSSTSSAAIRRPSSFWIARRRSRPASSAAANPLSRGSGSERSSRCSVAIAPRASSKSTARRSDTAARTAA
jgi:hypothetical protein